MSASAWRVSSSATLRHPYGDKSFRNYRLRLLKDPSACYLRNEAPSYEDRLILIALSSKGRLLFVVHAEVGRDTIRIISARKASPAQRRIYDEELD